MKEEIMQVVTDDCQRIRDLFLEYGKYKERHFLI
jgi:hypothetical protein